MESFGVQCAHAKAKASLGVSLNDAFAVFIFKKRSVYLWELYPIILAVWYLMTV